MKNNEQTHDEKVSQLKEVRKILPETINKVEHYKESLISEGDLLKALEKRQSSFFVNQLKKIRERLEIVSIKNSILNKQKIYESYLSRKKGYEKFLDEMSFEVSENFDQTLEEAKSIKTNIRLIHSIEKWENDEVKDVQSKIDFYLYLKTEIRNKQKFSK
jgi:hypothetical protein